MSDSVEHKETPFELPAPALPTTTTTTTEQGREEKTTSSLGKYTTPAKKNTVNSTAKSPTDLARTTTSIQDKGIDEYGTEHIFREVKTFRPTDVYSQLIPPERSHFGLDAADKLQWDYVVVFDIPDEDEEHPDIEPYTNSKWDHPALGGVSHPVSSNRKKKKKKRNSPNNKTQPAPTGKARRRSSIQLMKDKMLSATEDKYKYVPRDLVAIFYDISEHNGVEEDEGDFEEDVEAASPPGSPSHGPLERQSTIVRLAFEDLEWLKKREHLNVQQKLAPAIKHFPGRKFFERIFNEVAEGRDYLDARRYAIAKAFVVIGLLAEQCGLETYCHWSSVGDQIICNLRAEPPEVRV